MTKSKKTKATDDVLALFIIQKYFNEWVNNLQSAETLADMQEASEHFGCNAKSPFAALYAGFKAGMSAGLDLSMNMEDAAEKKKAKVLTKELTERETLFDIDQWQKKFAKSFVKEHPEITTLDSEEAVRVFATALISAYLKEAEENESSSI